MWKIHISIYCSDTENLSRTGKRKKLQNKNNLMPPKSNHLIYHSILQGLPAVFSASLQAMQEDSEEVHFIQPTMTGKSAPGITVVLTYIGSIYTNGPHVVHPIFICIFQIELFWFCWFQ